MVKSTVVVDRDENISDTGDTVPVVKLLLLLLMFVFSFYRVTIFAVLVVTTVVE